jgi:hypothetical protein
MWLWLQLSYQPSQLAVAVSWRLAAAWPGGIRKVCSSFFSLCCDRGVKHISGGIWRRTKSSGMRRTGGVAGRGGNEPLRGVAARRRRQRFLGKARKTARQKASARGALPAFGTGVAKRQCASWRSLLAQRRRLSANGGGKRRGAEENRRKWRSGKVQKKYRQSA